MFGQRGASENEIASSASRFGGSGLRASIPAWVPALDERTLRRRGAIHAGFLFAVCALVSWSFVQITWIGSGMTRGVATASLTSLPAMLAADSLISDAEADSRAELSSDPRSQVVLASAPSAPLPSMARLEGEPLEAVMPAAPVASSALNVITGNVAEGSTVSKALRDQGVSAALVHKLATSLRPKFDFRHARPGDFFALILDSRGSILSFQYQRGRSDVHRLVRKSDGSLVARSEEAPMERRVVQLAGLVNSSLFESLVAQGEKADLVNNFVDIFIWDFDFARETRPGDEYRLVFEKFYDQDGFVKYGEVLAAQYISAERDLTAVFFEDEDGYADYYTPSGTSVRRSFLRAPLRYSRISSRYSNARLHPVLKVRRPHHGIDYAAPMGTPIWAVADGEVIHKSWNGGFGRLVKIRHRNGYVSYYGHLSRYAETLSVGDRVRQKQVIGYVGSSGLSTGPHLDYRLRIGGRFVDPMKVKFPSGTPISVMARSRFDATAQALLAELNSATPAVVLEAAM
jgi:murein DD-endopeptidase MepM/ murein hydrolase activator NlpD